MQRAAHSVRTDTAEKSKYGKELAPSTKTYKALKEETLKTLLRHWAPKAFPDEKLSGDGALAKEDLLLLARFALALKGGAKLPSTFPSLRFEGPLSEYTTVRYKGCGNRLAKFSCMDEAGYFKRGKGGEISTNVPHMLGPEPLKLTLKLDGDDDDWVLEDNMALKAKIRSDDGEQISLVPKFEKKFGKPLFRSEDLFFEVLAKDVPDIVSHPLPAALKPIVGKKRLAGDDGGGAGSTRSVKTKAAPPKGAGRVGAKGGGNKK